MNEVVYCYFIAGLVILLCAMHISYAKKDQELYKFINLNHVDSNLFASVCTIVFYTLFWSLIVLGWIIYRIVNFEEEE